MEPKKDEGGQEPPKDTVDVAKLQEQITNLNKGIATYRDESRSSKEAYEKLQKDFEDFKGSVEVEEDDEVQLNPQDAKKLESWAKKQGFVTAEELEAEKTRLQQESFKNLEAQAVNDFLEKNKEFDDDEKWKEFKSEFSQYKTPTTLEGYKKVFNKILKDLGGSNDLEKGKSEARAELEKKGRLSLGGGSQKSGDAKTVEDFQKKYPNLSKEQIESRLKEIQTLYPEKKEKE